MIQIWEEQTTLEQANNVEEDELSTSTDDEDEALGDLWEKDMEFYPPIPRPA